MKYKPTRKLFFWLFFLIRYKFNFQRKRKNLCATFAGGDFLVFGNITNAENVTQFAFASFASEHQDIDTIITE